MKMIKLVSVAIYAYNCKLIVVPIKPIYLLNWMSTEHQSLQREVQKPRFRIKVQKRNLQI